MALQKVLLAFGTRPEAIKMAPVIKALKGRPDEFDCRICVTAQHRSMLDQVLEIFDIRPDFDLDLMAPGQDLSDITARALTGIRSILREISPDWILVHGDTTTTLSVSLAAFYHRIPLAHVEAGLRTGDLHSPWPEELNRRVAGIVADLHFAPTEKARDHLLGEGHLLSRVFVTGNTGIDALHLALDRLAHSHRLSEASKRFSFLNQEKKLVLVTSHRRENFGEGLEGICRALIRIALENEDAELIYPVHLNPNVRDPVRRILAEQDAVKGRIHLVDPVDYLDMVYLLQRSHLVLTDSGGLQEEAPGLGKPVLVMRDTTERPEVIESGCGLLVGTYPDKITLETTRLLRDVEAYRAMSSVACPYGDGSAAIQIAEILKSHHQRSLLAQAA